ncbi:hypothetical protein K1719_023765 [Acacia pycnantha]|nr:hypothetical protein K1719_023765 [Acacia pycnantha]
MIQELTWLEFYNAPMASKIRQSENESPQSRSRTLARCRNFEDTGRSCFIDPVLKNVLFAAPAHDKYASLVVAINPSQAQNSEGDVMLSGFILWSNIILITLNLAIVQWTTPSPAMTVMRVKVTGNGEGDAMVMAFKVKVVQKVAAPPLLCNFAALSLQVELPCCSASNDVLVKERGS